MQHLKIQNPHSAFATHVIYWWCLKAGLHCRELFQAVTLNSSLSPERALALVHRHVLDKCARAFFTDSLTFRHARARSHGRARSRQKCLCSALTNKCSLFHFTRSSKSKDFKAKGVSKHLEAVTREVEILQISSFWEPKSD